MAYLIIIVILSAIVYLLNSFLNPAGVDLPWAYYAIALVIYIAASVLVDGIVAFIIRRLPKKWMDPNKGMIKTYKWEEKLYAFLHVSSWKRFMPDLGMFTKFQKGRIADPTNNEYIGRYILEASYGVVIHYISIFTAPLVLFLAFIKPTDLTTLTVGVPVVIVNMFLILLPALSLKYNLPKLQKVYRINEKLAKRKEAMKAKETIG